MLSASRPLNKDPYHDIGGGKQPSPFILHSMQEDYKITLLERFFDRHMMAVSDRIGLENARSYARNVQGRIESAASIAGVSLLIVVILIIGMTGLDEDALINLLLTSILVIIFSIIHLVSIRKVGQETLFDEELSRKWKLISFGVAMDGMLCGAICLCMMFSTFDIGLESEKEEGYQVEYDKLGIAINVPAGWSEPHWEYKSDETAKRPRYHFRTGDPDHTMWFYVAGHSTRPAYDIMDFIYGWQNSVHLYLDKEVIENVNVVDIDSMKVLRVIGKRTEYPDFTYVCYRALHCCSLIDFTYCFRSTLPYQEELARSAQIFEMIDFTDVEVPLYKSAEDNRPADWSLDDGCLDIASVGMRFMLPERQEVRWEENSRRKYVFATSLGAYDLHFDLTVTYTSETADIMEFYEDFESEMNSRVMGGFKSGPCVKRLKDIRAMHAAGTSSGNQQNIEVRYELIYKGARLCVEAQVPSSMNLDNEIRNIENVMNSIKYY